MLRLLPVRPGPQHQKDVVGKFLVVLFPFGDEVVWGDVGERQEGVRTGWREGRSWGEPGPGGGRDSVRFCSYAPS